MNELEKLFYTSEHSSHKWQPYFEIYDRHLSKFRDQDINFVEVGVQRGGSLDMWGRYFPKAKVTGVDINPKCSELIYSNPNITVAIGDQEQPEFWDSFLSDRKIDVFVDDGGHTMYGQTLTFEKVFPMLELGGVYICEDTHTSYMPGFSRQGDGGKTFVDYARSAVDTLYSQWTGIQRPKWLEDVTSIHFYDSIVVFEKFGRKEMKDVFAR